MGKGKYSSLLTVVLIVVIVLIIGLAGFGIFQAIKHSDDNAIEARTYQEFEDNGNEYNNRKRDVGNIDEYVPGEENPGGEEDYTVVKKTYNGDGFMCLIGSQKSIDCLVGNDDGMGEQRGHFAAESPDKGLIIVLKGN